MKNSQNAKRKSFILNQSMEHRIMLPESNSPKFPKALKNARESKGLSYTQLAKLCGISPVMPARYEDTKNSNFASPSRKTWEKLDQVLSDDSIEPSNVSYKLLAEASVEELIQALKDKGATSVNLVF